jgi:hypothetical protein
MNRDTVEIVEQIANSVLYEGYILYPYRPSALKNRQRWNFGGLCPRSYAEAQRGNELWRAQIECLALSDNNSRVQVRIRFLHLIERRVAQIPHDFGDLRDWKDSDFVFVEGLQVGDRLYQTWQEAAEREIDLPELNLAATVGHERYFDFHLPESKRIEPLNGPDGKLAGVVLRQQQALDFAVRVSVERLQEPMSKLRLDILNLTPCPNVAKLTRDQAMTHSLASTHAILKIRNGEFVSLLDPPQQYAEAASTCANMGLYPVLAGDESQRSTILASPVIFYDYPKVAPESAGDLFDGAEIDEILTLRILALSDREKAEMRQCDERARRILDRVESDPEHLAHLHGTMRALGSVEGGQP